MPMSNVKIQKELRAIRTTFGRLAAPFARPGPALAVRAEKGLRAAIRRRRGWRGGHPRTP